MSPNRRRRLGCSETDGPPPLPDGGRWSLPPRELASLAGTGRLRRRDRRRRRAPLPTCAARGRSQPAIVALHERIKHEFDPQRRLNPGRRRARRCLRPHRWSSSHRAISPKLVGGCRARRRRVGPAAAGAAPRRGQRRLRRRRHRAPRVGVATAPMELAIAFADAAGGSWRPRCRSLPVATAGPRRRALGDGVGADRLRSADAWVDWERIGAMVRRVHDIDPATVDHPLAVLRRLPVVATSTPCSPARRAPAGRSTTPRGWARAGDRRARSAVERCRAAGYVLCHGDVHPGNVLVDADGPVLIDWDLLCVGPPEWDHAAAADLDRAMGRRSPASTRPSPPATARRSIGDRGEAIAELRLVAATLMRLRRARLDPAPTAAKRSAASPTGAATPTPRPGEPSTELRGSGGRACTSSSCRAGT